MEGRFAEVIARVGHERDGEEDVTNADQWLPAPVQRGEGPAGDAPPLPDPTPSGAHVVATAPLVPRFAEGQRVYFYDMRTEKRVNGVVEEAPENPTDDYKVLTSTGTLTVLWAYIGPAD